MKNTLKIALALVAVSLFAAACGKTASSKPETDSIPKDTVQTVVTPDTTQTAPADTTGGK